MMRARWVLPVCIALAGLVACAVVAVAGDIGTADALRLIAYAVAGAASSGVAAWLLLRPLRRASVATQLAIATLAPVVAVAIAEGWSASDMFIMSHDLWVLWMALAAACSAGLITAVLLGRRVAAATRSVGYLARALADDGPGRIDIESDTDRPLELAALAAELAQTSARLAAAQEQASAVERSRRELVAWVSHDLRTPLAGIRAMVEALEDGIVDDDATVARYHRTMRHEADRLAGLVDDLFELSRIEAGALSLDRERVGLDELLSDAVSGASIAADAKGVGLECSVRPPAPVVELSTPQMARVARNLLDNAIRHTPPGGTISIDAGLDETGRQAVVSVQDACGGIPEPDLDRVFDVAYRGDAARTPGDGGSGLGLAVARGLVEAHHGHISVHNEGAGCRFTFRLPLA
jgi:signal transduction histidine kinase